MSKSTVTLWSLFLSLRRSSKGERQSVRESQPDPITDFDMHSSSSCGEYLSTYLESHTGFLTNPTATDMCNFCRASNGDDYLETLNISFDDRWRSLGVLVGYTASNVLIAYLLVFFPPRLPDWIKNNVAFGRKKGGRLTAEEVASKEYERELQEILLDAGRGPL